jgi:hypothetical protein
MGDVGIIRSPLRHRPTARRRARTVRITGAYRDDRRCPENGTTPAPPLAWTEFCRITEWRSRRNAN